MLHCKWLACSWLQLTVVSSLGLQRKSDLEDEQEYYEGDFDLKISAGVKRLFVVEQIVHTLMNLCS